jgi:hypothetical protein
MSNVVHLYNFDKGMNLLKEAYEHMQKASKATTEEEQWAEWDKAMAVMEQVKDLRRKN